MTFNPSTLNSDHPRYLGTDTAFEHAINLNRLSADPTSPKYAGLYMYMGTTTIAEGGRDLFKHIHTREYLA